MKGNPDILNKFVTIFAYDDTHVMPDEDTKRIKYLIEDGKYMEAVDALIDYVGENFSIALKSRFGVPKNERGEIE